VKAGRTLLSLAAVAGVAAAVAVVAFALGLIVGLLF